MTKKKLCLIDFFFEFVHGKGWAEGGRETAAPQKHRARGGGELRQLANLLHTKNLSTKEGWLSRGTSCQRATI
jgi:hypothetical protein